MLSGVNLLQSEDILHYEERERVDRVAEAGEAGEAAKKRGWDKKRRWDG